MSLLDEFAESFKKLDKISEPDGAGGFTTQWRESAQFKLIVRHDTTIEARIAEEAGTASTYTFLFDKKLNFEFGDVVKRMKDGQVFKITQPSGEDFTPPSSGMNLGAVSARKWELPN